MNRTLALLAVIMAASTSLSAQTIIDASLHSRQDQIYRAARFVRPTDLSWKLLVTADENSSNAADRAVDRHPFNLAPRQTYILFRRQDDGPSTSRLFINQNPSGAEQTKALSSPPLAAPIAADVEKSMEKSDVPPLAPTGFRWKPALKQSFLLLAIQHGYAMTQPKTRRELRGPFFKDYFESVGNLSGWADGGRFFTNYIAHPLQGATTGFIQVQNDPKGMRQKFGRSKAYWTSRLKAMGWAAAMSTQFELGPISQAAIGNVGKARKLTYVDIIITPTVGTALLVSEDALERFVVRFVERKTKNLYLRIATRMLLNPSRSCANLFRFKKPWHRDR
ncbi:MAG: hypothetical protein M3458_12035 [Acidobacteriota bacterium]|nr:hypothetical protein [Acidobacteriota bacterium]